MNKPVASPDTLSGETMPVISLWTPWANWVSLGWKTIETRTHKRFASLKGRRIGIHASLKWDDGALDLAGDFLSEAQRIQTKNFLRFGGGIICTAFVEDHRELDPLDNERALIDCTHVTRYGLILSDIRTIDVIPCKGKQGIFYMPVAVALSGEHHPWCNFYMRPRVGCEMCLGLFRKYPFEQGEDPAQLLKTYFPGTVTLSEGQDTQEKKS